MYSLTLPTAVLVLVTATNKPRSSFHVDGFSTLSGVPCFRNSAASKIDFALHTNANAKRETTALFGILDDIMEEDIDDDQEQSNDEDSDEQLIELYHSLIFSSDLQFVISKRLEECINPLFLEYLNASSESSEDEEERQGLTELIDQIDDVKTKMAIQAADNQEKAMIAAKAKEDAEKEESETAAAATTESKKPISNADVLRKAGLIDAAIALSDEEKPSDFISDCREVVNLSRGFNDSGKMSVGGR
jgi:hypothetical protein